MPNSVAARNYMLNQLAGVAVYVSAHSAYPGDTGANEVSGGSPAYARKAKTWNSAASGSMDDSNAPTFDIPAGTTVGYVGLWSALTGGTFYGYAPAGGVPYRYTADAATDKITVVAHGYVANDTIVFINGTAPAGLTEGTVYYVKAPTTNDFQVSATAGGAAIDITAATQAASSKVSKIVQEVFGAQGQYQESDYDVDLSDV